MPESVRMWVEVVFNVAYLVTIWSLVVVMFRRRSQVTAPDRRVAMLITAAFALLALGDSGHVGFRVLAYALGGLEANPDLVGLGALSTAYTVTLFYMLLVFVWSMRFNRPMNFFSGLLLAAGVVRMVVMAFPQNQWNLLVPPYNWSLLRNAFLVVQGLGVMALILRDAAAARDRAFTWIGGMIALSYTFYTPVILWSARVPLLGMLMIPKTCAYIGVAVLAYRAFFLSHSVHAPTSAAVSI